MSKIIKKIDKKALLVFSVWGVITIIYGRITMLGIIALAVSVAYFIWQVRQDD